MEPFTWGVVTGSQRKYYLRVHPFFNKDQFVYLGRGKYKMFAWASQIARCMMIEYKGV
jgi:hypothetical protein